jgi:hypothetical protein
MKKIIKYLKINSIPYHYNEQSNLIQLDRKFWSFDFNKMILDHKLNIYPLDSTIVIQ